MKHSRVEFWDDERCYGNGIIVTLNWGWSFEPCEHQGVRGFDLVSEAKEAVRKGAYPCACNECESGGKNGPIWADRPNKAIRSPS